MLEHLYISVLRNTMSLALYKHIETTIKAIMFHVLRNLTQTILFIMTLTLKVCYN